MATTGIRGEVRLDTNSFAEDVKRVARGSTQAKEAIETINQADLTPIQRRIDGLFSAEGRRYSAADLFTPQQRAFSSGFGGDMRNVEGFKGAQTAAQMRQLAAATGRQRGGAGLAFLEFSRAVEDAQYGMRGVINNIPQMALNLGAGAGLTGVVSILAVGVAVLGTKLWDWANRTKEVAEATKFNDEMAKRLADTLKNREADAINGSIAGRAKLEEMSRSSAEAYRIETINAERNIAVQRAVADAKTKAAVARVDGEGPESVAQRGAIEIKAVQDADAARVAAIDNELARNKRLTKVAEDHASATANAAKRAAQDVIELGGNVSENGRRLAKIKAAELESDARLAKERAAEVARDEYTQQVRLLAEKEQITKTANDRIYTMGKDLQDKLAGMSKAQGQAAIDAYNAQMERHIAWKEQVDETVAKEKEKEAQAEAARQKEREAIAVRILINQARARGDEEEVKALEKKSRILNQIRALREQGFSPEEAESLATAEAASENGRRAGRNGRMRIGRPGRGKIGATGIDDQGGWRLDDFQRRNRPSLRDEMNQRIGEIGDEKPKSRRETREREVQPRKPESQLEKNQAESTALLREIAQKLRMIPISSGGERNYVGLP